MVKMEAGRLLNIFIYTIPSVSKRKQAINKLVTEFAQSKASFLKRQYI